MLMTQTIEINKLDTITVKRIFDNAEFKTTWVGKKLVWAALIPCGFDIENTRQFMYIWTFSVKNVTIVGYTWDDYRKLLSMIKETLDLGIRTYTVRHRGTAYTKTIKHRDGTVETKIHHKNNGEEEEKETAPYVLPVFIHHIKHEYAFMKYEFEFEDVFCIDKKKKVKLSDGSEIEVQRNPLYLFDGYFLYVDSNKIFPKPLAEVAKAYCKTQKTKDLDYNIDRNTDDAKKFFDEEHKKELKYCVNDTRILVELAQFVFDNYFLKYGRLPLTQNQIIKIIIKQFHDALPEEEQKAVDALLRSLTLTQDQHNFIRTDGFRGGHCASSLREIFGKVLYGDRSSAYCSEIIHGKYPMSEYRPPRNYPVKTEEDINYYVGKKCFQARLKFYNLRAKGNKLVKYESRNKVTWCFPDGSYPKTKEDFRKVKETFKTTASGKIWKAACFETSICDIDWEIYNRCYEWEKVEVLRFESCNKGELPNYIKYVAFELYGTKAKLKKAGVRGPAYNSAKTLVSNVFGCMVKRISKELIDGDEDIWLGKMLDALIKPQWGVYITANARKSLIDVIYDLGPEYWGYSDTDSFYADENEYTLQIAEKYNSIQKEKNKAMCEKYNLDYEIFDDLGCWDTDNKNITHFKTLGAKAYLYYDKNSGYNFVMSGVPEMCFWEAYTKEHPYCNIHDKETEIQRVFDFFDPKTEVTYVRNKVKFIDEETTEVINGMTMTSKSGCIITPDTVTGPLVKLAEMVALEQIIDEANTDVV